MSHTLNRQDILAALNIKAVLRTMEDLIHFDPESAQRIRDWNETIQFTVRGGPAAHLAFKDGVCTFGEGPHSAPTIKLFFMSPAHANRMFDGKANPIPLKGFTKLGFLKRGFTPLTERLAYFLKPSPETQKNDASMEVHAALTFHLVVYAVRQLAILDPICRHLAGHTRPGVLEMKVQPDGPCLQLSTGGPEIGIARGPAEQPAARMAFGSLLAAGAILDGRLNAFLGVLQKDLVLEGQLGLVDNMNLIMDRVADYLR